MSSSSTEPYAATYVPAYSAALVVFALLAGAVAWIEFGLIDELKAEGAILWATVLRIDQVTALVLSPLSLWAAVARWRGWPVARLLTQAVSIALVIVFPIGTALFVVWLVWVRRRESES